MRWMKSLFGNKSTHPTELPTPPQTPGRQLTAQACLTELFKQHGLDSTTHDDWVIPNGELPALRGTWHPGETHGRLDMQVLVRDGVVIEELFGGFGAGEIGLADALKNFTINSFHVLLSALWSRHSAEETEIETWTIAGRQFTAFIGNIGTRSSTRTTPPIPAGMMDRLEAAIQNEPLEADLHWFRFYVGQVNGEFTYEALKDNEPWQAGLTALSGLGWVSGEGFYSARLFVVLRAVGGEAMAHG